MVTLESFVIAQDIIIRDLGKLPYAEAFELQQTLQQEVIEMRGQDGAPIGHVLLVEHDPPVITISRRKTARSHLLANARQLKQAGVEIAETDRGGDITYHGPGQLVVYPILDLNRLGLRLHSYIRFLEEVTIQTLAEFGIDGRRDDSATGVWVSKNANSATNSTTAKICAMGVRVSRWVTMHGLALNVKTNLDHFNLIVPCGLVGRSVTSLEQQLGPEVCPTMQETKQLLVDKFLSVVLLQTSLARVPSPSDSSSDARTD